MQIPNIITQHKIAFSLSIILHATLFLLIFFIDDFTLFTKKIKNVETNVVDITKISDISDISDIVDTVKTKIIDEKIIKQEKQRLVDLRNKKTQQALKEEQDFTKLEQQKKLTQTKINDLKNKQQQQQQQILSAKQQQQELDKQNSKIEKEITLAKKIQQELVNTTDEITKKFDAVKHKIKLAKQQQNKTLQSTQKLLQQQKQAKKDIELAKIIMIKAKVKEKSAKEQVKNIIKKRKLAEQKLKVEQKKLANLELKTNKNNEEIEFFKQVTLNAKKVLSIAKEQESNALKNKKKAEDEVLNLRLKQSEIEKINQQQTKKLAELENIKQKQEKEKKQRELELKKQLTDLSKNYQNQITTKVRRNWLYSGAKDDWHCEVRITQNIGGEVLSTNITKCRVDEPEKLEYFKNSITRAVYKASPLPIAPDKSIFDSEVLFYFKVSE